MAQASTIPRNTNAVSKRTRGTTRADERRWRAVLAHDATFDGKFFYCVKTTGIYCRPSCPSKRPRRQNISFCESSAQAEREGYRPCRRCKPHRPQPSKGDAGIVEHACKSIARCVLEASEPFRAEEFARASGLTARSFLRLFKSHTGLAPRAYAEALRRNSVRRALDRKSSVTSAMLASGFNSSGRFYERTNAMLGMRPSEALKGGSGTTLRFAVAPCSLGFVLAAVSDKGVAAIELGDDRETLAREFEHRFPQAERVAGDRQFERRLRKIVSFVDRPARGLDLPLDIRGTAFQQRVWRELLKVEPGTTTTYAEIAKRIGAAQAVRAVASAIAANNVAVAIPCHRVIRTDGSLSGYRWGTERKRKLLDRELKGGK